MINSIDKRRAALGATAIVCGFIAGAVGQPLIHGNEQAVDVIVTVFSILAGFLVAITTILGDPTALLPGSWRIAAAEREVIRRRLRRQKWLFYTYLVTLAVIFVATLVNDVWPEITIWLERVYLGLAATGLILSMGLPTGLMAIQEERLDAVIRTRQKTRIGGP